MTAEGDKFIEKHVDQGLQDMELKIVRWIEGEKMIVVSIFSLIHMYIFKDFPRQTHCHVQ